MGFFQKLFGEKRSVSSIVRCSNCGRELHEMQIKGVTTGSVLGSAMLEKPYRCKSCGTAFCLDCMSSLVKTGGGICPKCKGKLRD